MGTAALEGNLILVWAREGRFGAELADVSFSDQGLSATGIAIATDPEPYRLDYRLSTVPGFVTERLTVRTRGSDWSRVLDLRRAESGEWSCTTEATGAVDLPPPGGDVAAVAGALDCDLALSPLTNTMPVLRHRLHERGGPVDFLMAWVSVPDLGVHPSRQRYTFIRRGQGTRRVRFEDLDGDFVAEIDFDEGAIVLDSPGIARRAR